jgi:hypothetical protein
MRLFLARVACRHVWSTGKGMKPMSSPAQDGRWIVAPLWPHVVQREHCLSLSLDTLAPQRITGTAQACVGPKNS